MSDDENQTGSGTDKKPTVRVPTKSSLARPATGICQPPPLSLKTGNVAANWKRWIQQWTFFEIATGLELKSEKVRVASLLSSIGQEGQDLYLTFQWEDPIVDKMKYDKVVSKFKDWCSPRKNVMFETFRFCKRIQEINEPVDCYAAELRLLADNCDFKDADRRIRDQVVLGLRDVVVQTRVLRSEDPSLEEVLTIVRASEAAQVQVQGISGGNDHSQEVSLVKKGHKQKKYGQKQSGYTKEKAAEMIKCKFCSREHEKKKEKCPAWQKKCKTCNQLNHFAACCKQKDTNLVQVATQGVFSVNSKGVSKKTKTLTVVSTGKQQTFRIDTGATTDVISQKDYVKVTQDPHAKNLKHSDVELIVYGGKKLKSVGKCSIKVKCDGQIYELDCEVVAEDAQSLLGLHSCEKLGLVKVLSCDQEQSVNAVTGSDKLLDEFSDVFTGLGKLKGQYTIRLKEGAKPVIHAPRRVPVALREPLKKWLQKCEQDGIVEKVTEPTDWVSSLLIVKEPNKLRMCLDPKDLNDVICREHYQLPTFEEVTARLAKVKVFSVLDAKSGFWHIELDKGSSVLTTFNTPFGRYKWLRMPFGICSAPEVWQRRMHEFAEDLVGVEVIADDFLVCGSGESYSEACKDHDNNLRRTLEKARKENLKLNKEKVRLRLKEVKFIGHLLTQEGVKMDPRKSEAIMKMPKPEDAEAVSRLLGFVQYLSKFLPSLSDVAEPLRRLTDKDAIWSWTSVHDKALEKIKQLVTSAPVLAYYDVEKPVTVQCDSSDKGMGAVLMQEGRPVTFSSRAMTKTETNYAQIEKEMLAIVHSCSRFHHYLYGRSEVLVETDHKPLEMIFRKPIGNAPKRLQRMLLAVQDYALKVTYKKGKEMYIADFLSRAFLTNKVTDKEADHEMNLVNKFEKICAMDDVTNTESRMDEIKKATGDDAVLKKVKQYIMQGWPEKKKVDSACLPYYPVRDQLVHENGLVFCGDRIVIPLTERKKCKELIHQSHIGIEGCLRRAREYVYWPRMNAEIKDYISACDVCNTFQSQQQKEPLESYEVPERAWETLSADIFEIKKVNYLIVVDHYSNFFEYDKLSTMTTAAVMKSLKSMFSRFGIPERLITDNGRQFVSEEFEKFMKTFQVEHSTSSPHHPQSNGKAENAVKTCKNLMKKAIAGKGDFYLALLDWRNTPSQTSGKSPAQLMFGRRTRTMLPMKKELLDPENQGSVKGQLEKAKEKQADYYHRGSKELAELCPGATVRMRLPGQDVWSKGAVLKKWGKRSYVVKVGAGTYRRNRRQLRATSEDPPEE